MSIKITYLLGAGASANALPLIKTSPNGKPGLPESLKSFLLSNREIIENRNSWDKFDFDTLLDIADQSITFGTPDLYAKYLIETGADRRYNILKRLLSNYFSFFQGQHLEYNIELNPAFDRRALAFLTTISLDRKLPENINIISWNYDWQIEMAAEKLKPFNSIGREKINSFSTWPNISDGESVRDKDPFLFHLNGIAGYDYSREKLCDKRKDCFDFSNISDSSLLSFAWEDESSFNNRTFLENRMRLASKIVTGTQILVVIGYSFPFFNRKIDDSIFSAMKPSLGKIYFQDPLLDGSQLKSQFNLDPVYLSIIHIRNVDNYYVPFEL